MSGLETMRLGKTVYHVSRLGMGCWAIGGHGWGNVRDENSISAIKCALENGVTFFDTADTYGFGKSESLLASVLGSYRSKVIIASKGGVRWNETGKVWTDTSPSYLRIAVENSLKRLKLDCIPLYYIHKPDKSTPIQESIEMLEHMREQGKIGSIGVANFSADQLGQALEIAPITAVQIRFNIFEKDNYNDIFNVCKAKNITLVAWGALADGLLTGKFDSNTKFSADDHRSRMPEFSGDNLLKYLKAVDSLKNISASLGKSISQLALRWVLDFASNTCSLFGAKTDIQLMENLGANGWRLSKEQLEAISSIINKCE
jgi:aryl-alcohol dehydrogenase-like predicted oxidoreductase